ncbi:MAG: hypoxanthine phosphoribosyltransferase [Acidimicrobiia bacterium]|nr:hypoxanthine phosphoribosyltransferase [Acidimicrobiia bacterium]
MGVEGVVTEVVPAADITTRVAQLGAEISADYQGKTPVVVGVLNAALLFLADLVRALEIPHEVEFLAVTRFGEGGRVRINMDTSVSLQDRHVLLVEDLVDTGLTLSFLRELFETRQVASLRTVTLLDKEPRRIVEVPLEYRGFGVGEEFLLGYGLDHGGRYRNLSSLWAVLDFAAFAADPEVLQRRVASGDRVLP